MGIRTRAHTNADLRNSLQTIFTEIVPAPSIRAVVVDVHYPPSSTSFFDPGPVQQSDNCAQWTNTKSLKMTHAAHPLTLTCNPKFSLIFLERGGSSMSDRGSQYNCPNNFSRPLRPLRLVVSPLDPSNEQAHFREESEPEDTGNVHSEEGRSTPTF